MADSQSDESEETRSLGSTRVKALLDSVCRQSWRFEGPKYHATVLLPFLSALLALMDKYKIPSDDTQYRETICRVLISLRFHWVGVEPPPAEQAVLPGVSCPCSNCASLNTFLGDKTKEKLRYPLYKRERQHIHQLIDGHWDLHRQLSHNTLRSREPQTLVEENAGLGNEVQICADHNQKHELGEATGEAGGGRMEGHRGAAVWSRRGAERRAREGQGDKHKHGSRMHEGRQQGDWPP